MTERTRIEMEGGRWFWLYHAAFETITAKRLGIYALGVYTALAHYANACREAFPSLRTLAETLNISRPKLIKALRELESAGLIQVIRQEGEGGEKRVNVYRLLTPKTEGGGKPDLPGVVNQVDHNKKYSNKKEESIREVASATSRAAPEPSIPIRIETSPLPDAAPATQAVSPPEKHSPRNALFDCIAQHGFGLDMYDAEMVKAYAGRIARIASAVKGMQFGKLKPTPVQCAMLADELRAAYAWHGARTNGHGEALSPPQGATTTLSLLRAYREHVEAERAALNPVSRPTVWDMLPAAPMPVAPMPVAPVAVHPPQPEPEKVLAIDDIPF